MFSPTSSKFLGNSLPEILVYVGSPATQNTWHKTDMPVCLGRGDCLDCRTLTSSNFDRDRNRAIPAKCADVRV